MMSDCKIDPKQEIKICRSRSWFVSACLVTIFYSWELQGAACNQWPLSWGGTYFHTHTSAACMFTLVLLSCWHCIYTVHLSSWSWFVFPTVVTSCVCRSVERRDLTVNAALVSVGSAPNSVLFCLSVCRSVWLSVWERTCYLTFVCLCFPSCPLLCAPCWWRCIPTAWR